jgi:undecaprenyl-diphosphatase
MMALLVTCSDQLANFFKETFERLRPNNDPTINTLIRVLKKSGGYSFLSAHATTSFAVSTFIILALKSFFKPIYLVLIWPLLFAYSRIYLGVHYPLDVLCGSILGIFIGYFFYKINVLFLSKFN